MNHKTPSPADRDEFDSPPEEELAALFAAAAPPTRPVDVDALFPQAVTSSAFHSHAPFFNRRNPMLRRITVLASATAGVAAVVALFVLFNSAARLSFAQVTDTVARTRSIIFKMTTQIPGRPEEVLHMTFLADGRSRVDMADGHYTVMDLKGTALIVAPREKKVTIMRGLYVPSGVNPYELFRNPTSQKSVPLPDETLDGRKANVFRVELGDEARKEARGAAEPMKVWVDPKTKLPVRMEPLHQPDKQRMVIDGIQFDQPVDESLLSVDPPKGYTVTTQGQAATWQEIPPAKQDLLAPEVIPGEGLGPVKFGMTQAEVLKLLGKPDVEERGNLQYASRGYACLLSPKRGLVLISVFSQRMCAFKVRDFVGSIKVRDFAGKSKAGIGIGSSLQDLEKAFGKPTAVEANGPQSNYVRYEKLGVDFTLFDDKVVGFMLQMLPATRNLLAPEVIPGVGLGRVKFGMSKEEIVKLLGKPDNVGEKNGAISVDYYPSRGYGCVIVPKRGGLISISCSSQEESAFKTRDFAGTTKDGIGIGSSLQDLEKAFGKPTAVEKTDVPGATGTYVRYPKLGLEFTLFHDKVVAFMLQRVR
jgi:outer membrane lipoprotein-sorting protein